MIKLNTAESQIMFCDLNSAFAMAEQQAHPSLRGRPMGVTNRLSKQCCVIAASYEAKALGVRVGCRLDEAKLLCPDFIMLETDPPKYHHIYQQLARIMKSYSPNVHMKSIDEGVIDLHGTMETVNKGRTLEDIGYEIKKRLRQEVGSWMKVNIGIAPNRFLAKQASTIHKPDGLERLDHHNLIQYYQSIQLTDLTGIASHFEARLHAAGIRTPLQFLEASEDALRRFVFHSIIGQDWFERLRGFEADDITTKLGSVGRQWVLREPSRGEAYLESCFQYLCQTTGKKLRYQGVEARGVLVWARFQSGDSWYKRKMYKTTFYSDSQIYQQAMYLFNQRPKYMAVQTMGITCYMLTPSTRKQMHLLEEYAHEEWLTTAVDEINERYGTFKVFMASALEGTKVVKQKIPFGSTKYFELLLKQA